MHDQLISARRSPRRIFSSPALILLSLAVFILCANPLFAQGVTLALSSGSGTPGSTVNLNIVLASSSTLPASLQWSMGYSAADVSSITVNTGTVATAAGKTVTCNPAPGSLNCLVFGFNTTTMSNGVVATVAVTLSASTVKTSTAITMSSGVASDPNGQGITPVTTTGNTISITQVQQQVPITVTTNPAGLGITVDGASYASSPQSFQWAPGSSHSVNVTTPQGSNGARYTFASWSDGGAQNHTITAPASAATYTASFQTSYLLTTTASPAGNGAIQASPSSADGYYSSGAAVLLTATPNSGFQFAGWGGSASGSANPTSVSMTAPRGVTASFTSTAQSVTVNTSPAGLGVIVDGASYASSPQSFQWTAGTSHTISVLTPQSSAGTRYSFAGWNDGGAQTHAITAPASAATYTASFQTSYLLTTAVTPTNTGAVVVTPASPDGYYAGGTVVQLTPSPASGYQFGSWSGGLSGGTNPASLVMNGPQAVSAGFVALSSCSYTLSRTSFAGMSEGDIGFVNVTAAEGCAWTASSNAPWLTVSAGASGMGNGIARFLLAANPSTNLRSGVLTIAGQSVVVGQAGTGCLPGIALPAAGTAPAGGGPLSLNVSAPQGCEWSSSVAPNWLSLNSAASGNGAGTAQLTAAGNGGVNTRTGTLSVGGIAAQLVQNSGNRSQIFSDVLLDNIFIDYIGLMKLYGITTGCTTTAYCPNDSTTRGQMAAFIIRSLAGENFTYTQTPYFTDVPASNLFFRYIQKMRDLGITNGCSATLYCPDDAVMRGQMAAFMIRARFGITAGQTFPYPAAIAAFQDVPPASGFFPYVQKMKQLGITSGCTVNEYCPDAPTTRGQMAVFLIRALLTP
ncbi:MAG: S-layer homology domain-containing protein [Bryobacterales bacterium]|nr:S-layer homology domain-containing protein [Bryobacterales bacterium]